jgi:membrane-associated phospholipid phosphatase
MICSVCRTFLAAICLSFAVGVGAAFAGDTLETSGDVMAALLPATAGITALALHDYTGGIQLMESTALSVGTALALKYAINERRPNGEDYSFPSGHAAVAFSSAEFIRKRYGWEYGLPAYAVATFVGYSRIETKQHYFHDVLAGAAIGIGSSYLFTTPYGTVNVAGAAGQGYYGVRLSGNW